METPRFLFFFFYQFDDFDEHPIVGRRCHQFEEDRRQTEIILRILSGQLADDVDRRRLDTYAQEEGQQHLLVSEN